MDLLLAEAEQRAERTGRVWIEKLELDVRLPSAPVGASGADPVVELKEIIHSQVIPSAGYREQVRELVTQLLDDLPAEARQFAGKDTESFDSLVDQLITQGSEDILSRLAAVDREKN